MCLDVNREAESLVNFVIHAAPVFEGRPPLPLARQLLVASDEIREIFEKVLLEASDARFDEFVRSLRISLDTSLLMDWLFAINVSRVFSRSRGRLNLIGLSNPAERIALHVKRGASERTRPNSVAAVHVVFRDNRSGITFLFLITRAESHAVNAFAMWDLLMSRREIPLLTQKIVILVFVVPLNREKFGMQSIEFPEFPFKEGTGISSIPGFGSVDTLVLNKKGIRTAKDLRSQLEADRSLQKYRSRLDTFEQWHSLPDVSSSLLSVPQFRLTIPKDFGAL